MSFKMAGGAAGPPHRPVSNTSSPSSPAKVRTPPTGTPTADSTVVVVVPNPQVAERYLTIEGAMLADLIEVPTIRSFALTQEGSAVSDPQAVVSRSMTQEHQATAASEYAQVLVAQLTQEEVSPTLETNPRFVLASLTEEMSVASSFTTVTGTAPVSVTTLLQQVLVSTFSGTTATGISSTFAVSANKVVLVGVWAGPTSVVSCTGFGADFTRVVGSSFTTSLEMSVWRGEVDAASTGALAFKSSRGASTFNIWRFVVEEFSAVSTSSPVVQSTFVVQSTAGGNSLQVSLNALANPENVTVGFLGKAVFPTTGALTTNGLTTLIATTDQAIRSDWSSAGSTNPKWTNIAGSSASPLIGIALELNHQ